MIEDVSGIVADFVLCPAQDDLQWRPSLAGPLVTVSEDGHTVFQPSTVDKWNSVISTPFFPDCGIHYFELMVQKHSRVIIGVVPVENEFECPSSVKVTSDCSCTSYTYELQSEFDQTEDIELGVLVDLNRGLVSFF